MGKKLIVAGFLISFGLAVYLFVTRKTPLLKENLESGVVRDPRVILESFNVKRYQQDRLVQQISAKAGHFIDPNVLKLMSEVRASDELKNPPDYLSCEDATVLFEGDEMKSVYGEAVVRVADFEDNVTLTSNSNILRSEFIRYQAEKDLLLSDLPVQFEGQSAVLYGDSGFRYVIDGGDFEMSGQVRGVASGEMQD